MKGGGVGYGHSEPATPGLPLTSFIPCARRRAMLGSSERSATLGRRFLPLFPWRARHRANLAAPVAAIGRPVHPAIRPHAARQVSRSTPSQP